MGSGPEAPWKTCQVCGGAVPGDGSPCPTCGALGAVRPSEISKLPTSRRRRLRIAQVFRVLVVVGVVGGIAYAILGALWTGPPVIADPLTTSGTYVLSPGNFTYLSGAITGEDYVDGNYTILTPVGTQLVFQVYNSSGFVAFVHHEPSQAQWSQTGPSAGPIVFAAPYTDTFYLVFQNPYQATSGIVLTVYIATNYQTNVVIG